MVNNNFLAILNHRLNSPRRLICGPTCRSDDANAMLISPPRWPRRDSVDVRGRRQCTGDREASAGESGSGGDVGTQRWQKLCRHLSFKHFLTSQLDGFRMIGIWLSTVWGLNSAPFFEELSEGRDSLNFRKEKPPYWLDVEQLVDGFNMFQCLFHPRNGVAIQIDQCFWDGLKHVETNNQIDVFLHEDSIYTFVTSSMMHPVLARVYTHYMRYQTCVGVWAS